MYVGPDDDDALHTHCRHYAKRDILCVHDASHILGPVAAKTLTRNIAYSGGNYAASHTHSDYTRENCTHMYRTIRVYVCKEETAAPSPTLTTRTHTLAVSQSARAGSQAVLTAVLAAPVKSADKFGNW